MAKSEANPGLMRSSTFSDDMIDNLGIVERNFLGGNHPNSVLTQEGLTILVVKGSIADQVAGAIVNSVGGNFDLRQGALSKSILEKAGPKIQESLSGLRPKVLKYAEVTTTNGFNLPASFVFHGVLKQWNKGKDDAEDTLRKFVRNCLIEAEKRRLNSIAIPAVGTGVLGFPSDLVVNSLFNEADKFSASNPNTTVNEIRFVIYDKDQKTFDAFEEKLDEIRPAESSSDSDDLRSIASDDDVDDDVELELDLSAHLRDLNKKASDSAVEFRVIGTAYPPTWKPTPPGKQYGTTILDSSDSEFKMVSKRVMETKGTASIRNIVKIERIENRTLYQLYSVYKSHMEQRNGKQAENERSLWHGTVKESLTNICSSGFNRSYCGKNAVVYGRGVYFARDFCYSAQTQYSRPDPATGTKYIFMCKVLTGTFSVGDQSMIEPEMKPGTDFRHDSTVNDLSDPSIFVIFKDAQAYPEYLVAFS